jgi:hypothetical protein
MSLVRADINTWAMGPHDPREVLSEEFPDATEDDITQAVDSLEEIAPDWVAKYPRGKSSQTDE